jgi:hypothetical protein
VHILNDLDLLRMTWSDHCLHVHDTNMIICSQIPVKTVEMRNFFLKVPGYMHWVTLTSQEWSWVTFTSSNVYVQIFTFATVSSYTTLWRAMRIIHLLHNKIEARGDRELNFNILSLFMPPPWNGWGNIVLPFVIP